MKKKEFYNKGMDLSSLHFIYIFIWLVTIILYSFHIIGYYAHFEWGGKLFWFLLANIFAMLLSGLRFNHPYQASYRADFNKLFNKRTLSIITQKANILFWIWVLGNIFTVILQNGFPLLWKVLNIPKTYADYGIPTFNGFLNSLYYICGITYFITSLKEKKIRYISRLIVLVVFPILTINRALFLVLILQCLGLFILTNKIKTKTLFRIVVLAIILIIGFGIVGDMRLGVNKHIIRDLVAEEYSGIQNSIPSGFIWTYLYSTGTIDNLNYNIGSIQAVGYPYYSLQPLIPSVLRNVIFGVTEYEHSYSLSMSNQMFNTFSWLANYLRDFGIFFTVVIVYLYGCLFKRIQDRARKGNIRCVFLYPVFFMVVVLSIFWDYMVSLPTIMEIIIICLIYNPRVIYHFEKENNTTLECEFAKNEIGPI